MEGRHARRAFTETQKKEILYRQNGKCAICHKKLDLRFVEFHHIKGWADLGRTVTKNGAALCPDCHRVETHQQRLKKLDKKETTTQPAPAASLKKLTTSQLRALAKKHRIVLRGKTAGGFFNLHYVAPPKSRYVDKLSGVVTEREIRSLLKET